MVALTKTIIWLTLINPLNVPRQQELIIVPFDRLAGLDTGKPLVVSIEKKVLSSQLNDMNFDGVPDAIAFLVDFKPKQMLKLSISNSEESPKFPKYAHAEISVRADLPLAEGGGIKVDGGYYISKKELVLGKGKSTDYRFEGPLIESDKVAYRIYADERGALDVYGKTGKMFVGEHHTHKANHHTMQPWGRDVLHNGKALGIGALGIGTDANRFSPYSVPDVKIIIGNDGPIYASVRMVAKDIEYHGKKYDIAWDMAMSAGKRYIVHNVTVTSGEPLEMLAAMTNHLSEKGVTENCQRTPGNLDWVATYGKQVYPDQDPIKAAFSKEQLGLGLLWPAGELSDLVKNDIEFDAVFKPAKELRYYSLAAYNGEYGSPIKSDGEFYSYMAQTAECLANPVIVKVEDKSISGKFEDCMKFAASQLSKTAEQVKEPNKYPLKVGIGDKWQNTGPETWTSGFFPGCLWYMYEWSGDKTWADRASRWTANLEKIQFSTSTHDVAFIMFCSYGNGLRLTKNDSYKPILLQTAQSLAKRCNPVVGCIRSWGDINDKNSFKVIIDNMMNLELLFWASQNGGSKEFYDIAVRHAEKTIKEHIRPDGSTFHVVDFDPVTGAVIGKYSAQGYALDSCWSRGQAWAIYGFTMAYRYTHDSRFLQAARSTADYFINNLPPDFVPYWDFEAPGIPCEKKDASAASIAASAFLELSTLVVNKTESAKYFASAENILKSLSSSPYLASHEDTPAILLNMVASRIDSRDPKIFSYIYGDYFYLEALVRYKKMVR